MSYKNTLITIAPDCPVESSETPISNRTKKPIHLLQFEMLVNAPYTLDHKALIFETYLIKEGLVNELAKDEKETLWNQLFSKGHPCLRASSLTKRYGYGAHYNEVGKIALYPMESVEYANLVNDAKTKKIPAMRSKRKSK